MGEDQKGIRKKMIRFHDTPLPKPYGLGHPSQEGNDEIPLLWRGGEQSEPGWVKSSELMHRNEFKKTSYKRANN